MRHVGSIASLCCLVTACAGSGLLGRRQNSTQTSNSSTYTATSSSGTSTANLPSATSLTSRGNSSATASNVTITSSNSSIPVTSTGSAYASSCNLAKQEWVAQQGLSFVSTSTFITTSLSTEYDLVPRRTTITSLAPGATPYTLCDGFARINGTTEFLSSNDVTKTTYTYTSLTTSEVYANVSAPQCMVGSSDCADLSTAFASSSLAWREWYNASVSAYKASQTYTAPEPTFEPRVPPICGSATVSKMTTWLPEAVCAQNTASLTLLYWPVQTTSGCDLCTMDACETQTLGPTISGQPNTIVTLNTTLTSPTVYMHFDGTWRLTSSGHVLTEQSQLILPQSSESISSYCGKLGGGIGPPESFNFANLNNPVPASAYRCQPKCFTNSDSYTQWTETYTQSGTAYITKKFTYNMYPTENLCSTIWNDYDPMLSIPSEFKTMSPAQAQYSGALTCDFYFNEGAVFWDPPIALTQVDQAAKPTLPVPNSSPSPSPSKKTTKPGAEPGETPTKATPKPTAQHATPAQTRSSRLPEGSDPTTQNIGGIIASVIGATQQKPQSSNNNNGQPSAVAGIIASVAGQSPNAGGNVAPAPSAAGAVLTGSQGQAVTFVKPSGNNAVIIGSVTLPPGATTNVAGLGQVVIGSTGVVVNGASHPFSTLGNGPAPVLTFQGQLVTANADGAFVVAPGSTLVPTVISGTTFLRNQDGSIAVLDGVTQTLASPTATNFAGSNVLTIGDQVITADAYGDFSIAPGQVLTPGGEVTVSGTTLSLDSAEQYIVVNGITRTLSPSASDASAASITSIATDRNTPTSLGTQNGSGSGSNPNTSPAVMTQSSSADRGPKFRHHLSGLVPSMVVLIFVLA